MPAESVTLTRYGLEELSAIRPVLLEVYEEVYAAEIVQDEFFSVPRFADRLEGHASRPGWEAVVAYDGNEVTGYAYASPLPEGSRWWAGMLDPLPEEETRENGKRTLALFELMVRAPWRKTGVSHQVHEKLLAGRREERVTLLVEPEHPKVKALYEQWGYRHIGDQKPFDDSPVYASMVRPLR